MESLLDQKYRNTGEFEYVLYPNIKCFFYGNLVVEIVNVFFVNYSVIGLTPYITRVIGRMSEGTRIHISETTKHLLVKLGGFRCEYREVLDLEVSIIVLYINIVISTQR